MLSEALRDGVARAVRAAAPRPLGRLARVRGMVVEMNVPGGRIGALVDVLGAGAPVTCEIVGFHDELALAVPYGDTHGLAPGAPVRLRDDDAGISVSDAMIGRIVDPFGQPLDGGARIDGVSMPIAGRAPSVGERTSIRERFDTGVRALDALLTCGRGQRFGVFAGAGVGKTVLMRQIAEKSAADVTVIGLVGERGCEVRDVYESSVRRRSVMVVATSDRSPLERARGALAATAVAEYFRDRGASVLLIIDSLTRYAMALREIGLAAGEPPATKGYPPSVFAALPRLLERVAPLSSGGSITGCYTVLVEGDDLADPVADSARSLLDGHIVLSRALAARGHFPAIDVLASASRVARQVTEPSAHALASRARALLATRKDAEDLRSLGAYVAGANPAYDEALALGPALDEWSRQDPDESTPYEEAIARLGRAIGGGEKR